MANRATIYGAVAQVAVRDPAQRATIYGAVAQVAVFDGPTPSGPVVVRKDFPPTDWPKVGWPKVGWS